MVLVGSNGKDIKVNVYDVFVYIFIGYHLIYESDAGNHHPALICGVYYLCFGFVLQYVATILNGSYQIVAFLPGMFEQHDVS